jgi:DNA-directed RNA polymerase specialized sigma24 family protein
VSAELTFDGAATALVLAARDGSVTLDRQAVDVIDHGLRHFAKARIDADTVSEALLRLIRAARAGKVDADHAAGWLLTTARNVASERARRSAPPTEPLEVDPTDPREWEATELLTREQVTAGLRNALAAGEYEAVRIASCWLDAAADGSNPSSREVAELAEVSHPTVAAQLKKLRQFFPR